MPSPRKDLTLDILSREEADGDSKMIGSTLRPPREEVGIGLGIAALGLLPALIPFALA